MGIDFLRFGFLLARIIGNFWIVMTGNFQKMAKIVPL